MFCPKGLVDYFKELEREESERNRKRTESKSGGGDSEPYEWEIVWKNVFFMVILHAGGFWGWWQFLKMQVAWQTFVWAIFLGFIGSEGVMVGNHRFFCHKSFKGNFWFKLIAMLAQTVAGQNHIFDWSRDHRLHHKYSDTDADPYNSRRGFFFCHMGWVLLRKHPMIKKMGKNIDVSDLEAEPIVMFQKKYYYPLYFILGFAIPVAVPVYFWGETLKNAILFAFFSRYMSTIHGTWTVNSFAHLYGYRPYSKDIPPVESTFVAFITHGEGWHNFHHTFPWDYRAGEYGKKWNLSAKIVDWFASWGMAYDLRCATDEMVKYRVNKRGDGTHPSVQKKIADAHQYENVETKTSHSILSEEKATTKFGEDDSEDIYGEKISSAGFTVLKRARA